MSGWVIREINIDLSTADLTAAIAEIRSIQRKLPKAVKSLVEYLAKKGVEIAKAHLIFFPDPAYYTGELSESIRYSMDGENSAVIAAGNEGGSGFYAAFVEFGTGIFNENSNRGFEGWYYYNDRDGRVHWTNGMAPRPFMGLTFYDLETEVKAVGGKIVAEYLG